MKKNESNTARENSNFSGMMGIVMISVFFLVAGGIMIFFPQIEISNFVYVIGGFLLVGGAWEIARYFLREEYRNIANFDFSIGVLALIAGCVLILRADDAAAHIYMLFGVMVLILGVTLLQHTFALHALKSFGWIVTLIFSVALILFSVAVLLDYGGMFSSGYLIYYLMAASGLLGIVSLFAVGLRIRHFERELVIQKRRDLDEDFFSYREPAHETIEKKPEEHVIDVPDRESIEQKKDDDIFEDEGIVEEEKTGKKSLKERLLEKRAKIKKQEPDDDVFAEE